MTLSLAQTNPVLWHEGMLLAPQHFQQNDIYWNHQLCRTMAQLQPYYWGILELVLNKQAFDDKKDPRVEITRLSAVMQDGTHVQINEATEPGMLTCPLENSEALNANKPAILYLCVPYRLEGAASHNGVVQRYVSAPETSAVDEASGEGRVQVLRMRPNVQISLEKLGNHYCMPLLIIRKDVAKKPYDITAYHPPLLRMGAGDFQGARSIRSRIERLVASLREKAVQLAKTKTDQRQFLYALTASLPQLEVLVQEPGSHPFELYQALAVLLGQASALTDSPVPPRVDAYEHENPGRCFYRLLDMLDDLVAQVIIEFEFRDFSRTEEDHFRLLIERDWLLQPQEDLLIEVVPGPGQTFAEVEQWLHNARIGSEPMLPTLVNQRSSGAQVERLTDTQRYRYNQNGNALMFRLRNRTFKDQKVIQPNQPLSIRSAGRLEAPERIILYIIHNGEIDG